MSYQYLTQVSSLLRSGVNVDWFADSLSDTQYRSKRWLVEQLYDHSTPMASILIVGGWYGSYLVPMLDSTIKPSKITLNDIDSNVLNAASLLHRNTKCLFETDLFDADKSSVRRHVDILINTSCEHMNTIGDGCVSNDDCLYVLQSCDNKNDPGHINVARSTEEFIEQTGLTEVVFSGRQNLGHKNRFMVIGYK